MSLEIADNRGGVQKTGGSAMTGNASDQRRHPRHDIPLRGYLQSGGAVVPCRVRNISAGGALVEASANLRLGDWATIKVPHFGSITGRVARVASTFIGIAFSDGEQAVDAFILQWLALNGETSESDSVDEKDGQPV